MKKINISDLLRRFSVPLMFVIICAICAPMSGLSPSYLINQIVTRMGRNAFLILSLLIPIMAGMGLNFSMTLGAMAGEIGLILVSDWQIIGIPGMVLAMIISVPISVLLGLFCGKVLNMAKGREMYKKVINLEVNLEDQKLINLLKNDLFIIEENNTDDILNKNKKKNENQRNKNSDIKDINNKIEDFETNNEALLYALKELNKRYENLIINKRRNNGNKERKQT